MVGMSRCCTGSALPALPLSRPPCQQGSRRLLAPPGSITKASTERVASEPSLSPNSQGHQQSGRLKVIGCIGACVDADAAVERFETVAGRSAMIGFLVAAVSELLIARPGQAALFQPADAHTLQSLGPAAALLVAFAAVLGSVSKRRSKPLTEAVFDALTSLPARKLSCGHQRLNAAVDRVFDSVLNTQFFRQHFTAGLEIDDFI